MVDPFYQKSVQSTDGRTQMAGNKSQQANTQQAQPAQQQVQQQQQAQIQQVQQQQQQLTQQYAQLQAMLQNPKATAEQKQQAQQQMQALSLQFQKNTQILQAMGVTDNHVTKPTDVKKRGSKISMKKFLIGCGVLFLFIVGGLVGVFYYLIQNPRQLASVGLDPETTKTLLQAFTTVFFGLLLFAGIGLLIVNIYRLITVKNKSKISYVVGAVVGFIIFIASIALGSQVLTMVRNISPGTVVDADKILVTYVGFKSGPVSVQSDPSIKLIAPSSIYYMLNNSYFVNQIAPTLGQADIKEVFLNCGNGQTLSINLSTSQFNGACVYMKKGEYTLSLDLEYINVPTGEKVEKNIDGGTIDFESEVAVSSNQGELTYNDNGTEIIAGKVPAKISFDATEVFRDFSLPDYIILWDVNDDGEMEKQNTASFTYLYTGAKLYNVNIRFPGLNNYVYTFPLRIEQSDVPICEVVVSPIKDTSYAISTSFWERDVSIDEYSFSVLDQKDKSKVIDTMKNDDGRFDYQFPGAGIYAIKVMFLTDEGKQGECESDDIKVGVSDFDVLYTMNYKSPGSPVFKEAGSEVGIEFENNVMTIKEIPTIIQVNVSSISPISPSTSTKVLFDGKQVLSTDDKIFEMTVDTNANHSLVLVVEDSVRGTKTEEKITISVNTDDIIAKLLVKPDTVGTDPFEVTFDASTTVINDPDDEIVFFSWDFGDGEIKKNLSQSIITHIYKYDIVNESGTFTPILTIKTKKGRELSISPDTNITVKKALIDLKIYIDSHPAQIASIGDRVNLSLEVDGVPTKIEWEFGDGKTLECQGRECVQTTTMYDQPGEYIIRAKISYDDRPEIEGNITLRVN